MSENLGDAHLLNDTAGLLRILDANVNRATEGLRVVEEYVRFVLDDRHLTEVCKQLRHDVSALLVSVSPASRLTARETQTDVGTSIRTSDEFQRADVRSVLEANFRRVQQSLRCLEEYVKIRESSIATGLESLRYRSYTLERAVGLTIESRCRLAEARLYVLVGGGRSLEDLATYTRSLIDAGVDLLQLRTKQLNDCETVQRGRILREITESSRTLLIINDRPDIAAATKADGVHLGQEDISVKDARSVLGTRALIGVSTHSLVQARQAVIDGANYIGVGPTFPSYTKEFDNIPGIDLLHQVSAEIRLPAFAIGGIDSENLADVLSAGMSRIAVQGTVERADDPAVAAQILTSKLRPSK